MSDVDWKSTPIYIINFNNLDRGFRRLVAWLIDAEMTDINVVDNASTYQPLLDYYTEMSDRLRVVRLDSNYGAYAFWETKMHESTTRRYIVSDADVVPDAACPKDLVKKMSEVFDRYLPSVVKVGPGIRIDNLPDTYVHKQKVIEHETQFWDKVNQGSGETSDVFCTILDTTFAMYGQGSVFPGWSNQFRLNTPYVVEHIPWYDDSSMVNVERDYYMAHANMDMIHW
jgi:hypothetical protein